MNFFPKFVKNHKYSSTHLLHVHSPVDRCFWAVPQCLYYNPCLLWPSGCRLAVWLTGCVIGWLIGWLDDWLIGWLTDWLVGWWMDRRNVRQTALMDDSLADWLGHWLTGWLTGWGSGSLNGCVTGWLAGGLTWLAGGWRNEWVSEWVTYQWCQTGGCARVLR